MLSDVHSCSTMCFAMTLHDELFELQGVFSHTECERVSRSEERLAL